MKSMLVAAGALALVAGCATAEQAAAPPVKYTVVSENAAIVFASQIRGYRVGKDEPRSLLVEGGNGKWYRVGLREYCRRQLPWENAIGVDAGVTDRFDKFSTVIIDGVRCQVETVDEIVDPDHPPAPQPAA